VRGPRHTNERLNPLKTKLRSIGVLSIFTACGLIKFPSVPFTYPKNGVAVQITDQTSVNQIIPVDSFNAG
jgi:hypothetical protein